MIDTIVLTLTEGLYRIGNADKFEPSAWWAASPSQTIRSMQYKKNPTKKDLARGIYKPRLTLLSRNNLYSGIEKILKIELSLPKLFFGNNFEELRSKDFLPVVKKLRLTLKQMGVVVTEDILVGATISVIHLKL